ncbi:MAG: hypothetical protein PHS92_02720 [Candidatus Gracilibacteria bacterium]|nr:hypothetical protein [Candidatus Gracilibacteria bacterium]
MRISSTRGNTIIYAIILANIALFVLYMVMSKTDTYISTIDYQNYSSKLNRNIQEKSNYAIKDDLENNLDGTGFIDTIKCPSNITLSGTTASGQIMILTGTEPYYNINSQTLYCSGTTASGNLLLTYNTTFTGFTQAEYMNGTGNLNFDGTNYSVLLNDVYLTNVSFIGTTEFSSIDSNFNSDDYTIKSYSGVYYPNNYIDNDNIARKRITGYIKKRSGFFNIFWNNYKTNEYISENTNNLDNRNVQIGETSTGKLYIDVDNSFNLKVIEFNSGSYRKTKELVKINEWNGYMSYGGQGYISLSGTGIFLTGATSPNVLKFDFKNKNYGIFLEFSGSINTSATILNYVLKGENEYSSGIYLNPINDSYPDYIGYLGSDIILNKTKFLSNIQEVNKAKQ